MDQKVLEVLSKGLGLAGEAATPDAVKVKLSELGVPDGALFTQEEVNAFIAKDKRTAHKQAEDLQKRLDNQSKALEQQTQQVGELLTRLTASNTPNDGGVAAGGPGPAGDPNAAAIVGVEQRLGSQLKRMESIVERQAKELQEERRRREEAEQKTLEKERDNALISAARKAGMIEPERNAPLHFRDRVRKDDKGQWTFLNDDDLPAESIEEGIAIVLAKQLPYLREARVTGGGGSGGPGSANPLKAAEDTLKQLEAQARANPRDPHLQVKVLRVQRELKALKAGKK